MINVEGDTWLAFKDVVTKFLGNTKDYDLIIRDMLDMYIFASIFRLFPRKLFVILLISHYIHWNKTF